MIHQRIVPSLLVAACAAALGYQPSLSLAGDRVANYSPVSSVAEREIVRRQDRLTQADQAMKAGDDALAGGQNDQAVAQYKLAVDLLPDALATNTQRAEAMDKFSNGSMKLAQERIDEGRYADAQAVVGRLLEYDPENADAKAMIKHLADPDYYNKTIGPKFVASVEQVKKYLAEAEGFFDSGRYDLAFKRCEQVLNIDPYNVAARREEEKINKAKTEYGEQAYVEARSRALWQVTEGWANPVNKFGIGGTGTIIQPPDDLKGTAGITAKLNRIIIPRIEFKDATIREAIDYLKSKSRDLDDDKDPAHRGVNIVLKLSSSYGSSSAAAPVATPAAPVIPGLEPAAAPATDTTAAAAPADTGETPITLSLSNVPMIEALKYITNLANLKFKIEPYAVSIVPLSEPTDVLITKQYQVPPGFIANAPAATDETATSTTATTGGTGDAQHTGSLLKGKLLAKDFLEGQGVVFPPGSSAIYQAAGSRLIVKNTQENMDLVDTLVSISNEDAPKQVEIEAKFVDIEQTNNKELSFDWLLGQFSLSGSNRVYAGGGTQGTSPTLTSSDYPFVDPNNGVVGNYPVTGGNRSGAQAITGNAIDALLANVAGSSTKAPGIFGIAGVFTDPQFQMVLRALDQKKGVDLLSAPRVTTKSGLRAVVEVIREFRYPTEFDPPKIPDTFNGSNAVQTINPLTGVLTGSSSNGSFPVTPTTPTSFETRNTGVTLEVEPQVGPDGQTIDLTLAPSVTEFEGFINYGSPIQTTTTNSLGVSSTNVITSNTINQPIFSTRKVQTQVSIWDGQTVVIGGLMREDVQKVEDKTPFLGDIPLVGRLFRSNVEQHIKRNLVVFVTARLMNPAGQPINNSELEEETVQPMPLTEAQPASQPEYAK